MEVVPSLLPFCLDKTDARQAWVVRLARGGQGGARAGRKSRARTALNDSKLARVRPCKIYAPTARPGLKMSRLY